jgi:hypothetical protein
MHVSRSELGAIVALILAGCGGEANVPSFEPSLGPRIDPPASITPAQPQPPANAEPPQLLPCARGWREVTEEGFTFCDPWPELGTDTCARAEMQLPGEPGCRAIGAACPEGQYAEDLAADVLYVSAQGTESGDGGRDTPFRSIAAAIQAAHPGTTIAIGRGRYEEKLLIATASLTFAGACAKETLVTWPRYEAGARTFDVIAPGTRMRNLSVGGERTPIGVSSLGATLELEGVAIEDVGRFGIAVEDGAAVVARELLIRNVRESPETPDGVGVIVNRGSTAVLENFAIEQTIRAPLIVATSTASLIGGVFRDAAAPIFLYLSSSAFEGLVIERQRGGIFQAEGGTATLTDSVAREIRDVHTEHGALADGIFAATGAVVSLRRVMIDHYEGAAVIATERAALDIEDVLIRDGFVTPVKIGGLSLSDANVRLRRTAFLRARQFAVLLGGETTTLEAEDLIVADTLPSPIGDEGFGFIGDAGQATIRRAHFYGNLASGIFAQQQLDLRLEDIHIRDTRPRAIAMAENGARFGHGLELTSGARVEIVRGVVEDNHVVGILAARSGTMLRAEDLVVRTTHFDELGLGGDGIAVQVGAHAELLRARIEGNHEIAIAISASTGELSDIEIIDTYARPCGEDLCALHPLGVGLGVWDSAAVRMQRFAIRRSAFAGVLLAENAELDLADGEVSGNPIGMNLRIEGYDLTRLSRRVIFRDNALNLQALEVQLPPALSTLDD